MPVALTRRRKGSWKRPRRFLSREWQTYYIPYRRGWVVVAGRLGQQLRWVGMWTDGVRKFDTLPAESQRYWTRMKKKKAQTVTGDAVHVAPVESKVFQNLHSLVKHCAVIKYDDGDPRKAGWFTVKTMGSAWVVEVKDPDSCNRLCVVQATLDDALTLAAMLLDTEDAPWEPDQWLQQQAAKNAKKK